MNRTYEYRGYTVDVGVEADCDDPAGGAVLARRRYVAVVRIVESAGAPIRIAPLKLGEAGGRAFTSEVDALMGGYTAGRRLIDHFLT